MTSNEFDAILNILDGLHSLFVGTQDIRGPQHPLVVCGNPGYTRSLRPPPCLWEPRIYEVPNTPLFVGTQDIRGIQTPPCLWEPRIYEVPSTMKNGKFSFCGGWQTA